MKLNRKPKFKPTEEDQALFRQTIGEIKPIKSKRLHLQPEVKYDQRKRQEQEAEPPPLYYFPNEIAAEEVDQQEQLFYATPGINPRTLRALRQGKVICERRLDLHGLMVTEAEQILFEFLEYCQNIGARYVCVIHGKGNRNLSGTTPILKNKVNHWLRNTDKVLAFCSAVPRDGGAGSVYVLLKKK